MEPWQSWTAAIILGGAAAWYYSKDSKVITTRVNRAGAVDQTRDTATRRRQEKEAEKTKQTVAASSSRETTTSSILGQSKKRKSARTDETRDYEEPSPNLASITSEQLEEDNDDHEWAQQLEALKKGVALQSSSKQQAKTKSNKKKSTGSVNASTPHGNIAPDTSQASVAALEASTDLNTHQPTRPIDHISDMLDAPAAQASVLRITGQLKNQKERPALPMQPKETAKQRQNRKKAEENKLVRQQQEHERLILLEKQRRQAREARGEPAKNGLALISANNPWPPATPISTKSPQDDVRGVNSSAFGNEPTLLDTFDQDVVSTASSNEQHTTATTPATVASTHDQDLPSEEVQIEMLNELNKDIGWNEVPAKVKKSKKRAQNLEALRSMVDREPVASDMKRSEPLTKPAAAPGEAAEATNGFSILTQPPINRPAAKGHPEDSDWAVL